MRCIVFTFFLLCSTIAIQAQPGLTLTNALRLFGSSGDTIGYIRLDSLQSWLRSSTITGSGAANRIAYWSGSNSLTSSANLTYASGVLTAETTDGNFAAEIGGWSFYQDDDVPSLLTHGGVSSASVGIFRGNYSSHLTALGLAAGAVPSFELIRSATGTLDTLSYNFITSKRPTPGENARDTAILYAGKDGKPYWYDGTVWYDLTETGGSSPSVISPSQITSDQNDYNPTGWADATLVRLSGDSGFRAITGLDAESDGEEKKIINVGAYPIYFPADHPSSSAGNRITGGQDFILPPGASCDIIYDGTSARWRILNMPDDEYVFSLRGNYYRISPGTITAGDMDHLALASGGGTISGFNGNSSFPGRLRLATGTGATNRYAVYIPKTVVEIGASDYAHMMAEFLTSVNNLSTADETFTVNYALSSTPTTSQLDVNNSVGIRYSHSINSGKWQGYARDNAGSETTVDLGVTVSASVMNKLRIELNRDNTEVRFYIDGAYVGRVTANMPANSTNMSGRCVIAKSVGTTSVNLQLFNMAVGSYYP